MNCKIYRSLKKDEMYLYLDAEADLDDLPEGLRRIVGRLELAMELELTPERKLARADVNDVLRNIREKGYHLQVPPELRPDMYFGD
jgi:hypothetical protein